MKRERIAGPTAMAVLLCLGACAQPQKAWVSTSTTATAADFKLAQYDCQKDTRQSGYFGTGFVGAVNMSDFFSQCMAAHGWTLRDAAGFQAEVARNKQAISEWKAAESSLQEECKESMNAPELDAIRDKIELIRTISDPPPPFSILNNQDHPNQREKIAISKWSELRRLCRAKTAEHYKTYPIENEKAKAETYRRLESIMVGKIDAAAVDLYQEKITYGEFARRRMEAGDDFLTNLSEMKKDVNKK